MIAVDTSSLIAYLAGESGADVEALDMALANNQAHLPPVVLTEILSDAAARRRLEPIVTSLPLLDITDGFWQRAAHTRSLVLRHRLRARLADALICQSCLDYDTPLIARDGDFKHFAKHCQLTLI